MPVRVSCPHCRTPCLVAEQHLGVPVQCGRCARTFTTRADVAPAASAVLRLDLGVATSPGRVGERTEESFLVQHLVCSNLDERRELAMVAVADGTAMRTVSAALTPLLNNVLSGPNKDAAGIAEAIAACKGMDVKAAVVVVWDGQVHIGRLDDCRLYHQRTGQLVQVTREPMKLTAGDWLIVARAGPHTPLDASFLQSEIAKASPSAAYLAQRLVERAGSDNCTVVALRCH